MPATDGTWRNATGHVNIRRWLLSIFSAASIGVVLVLGLFLAARRLVGATDSPLRVELLTNRVTGSDRKDVLAGLADGSVDILWIHSFNGGLELQWEHPLIPELTAKLNAFARVIRHDMRGTGLSDRYAGLPDLETEARDVIAVLESIPNLVVERIASAGQYIQEEHPAAIMEAIYALQAVDTDSAPRASRR